MAKIIISDSTLRDGNHAVKHQLTLEQIAIYAQATDIAGVDIIEVGHGNGLGASSLQLGFSKHSDKEILNCARKNIKTSKLGIHIIPGLGRKDDLQIAIDEGVDVIRVASHCTEADTTQKHIKYANSMNKIVYGVLMMSHMADNLTLLEQAKIMVNNGAHAIILMDSAGNYSMEDTKCKVSTLVELLSIPIGFHAHNNLGLSIANSICAIQSGATIIDGTAKGFGAGAGNTPIEVLVAILHKMKIETNIDLYKILDATDIAQKNLMSTVPFISSTNIISGLYGVFSGFDKHVCRIAIEHGVDPKNIYRELGKKGAVAGQEDLIMEAAYLLKSQKILSTKI